jgi:hypothetical protein
LVLFDFMQLKAKDWGLMRHGAGKTALEGVSLAQLSLATTSAPKSRIVFLRMARLNTWDYQSF